MFIVDNFAIYSLAFTNCFFFCKQRDRYTLRRKKILFGNLAIWKIKHRVSNVSNTTGGWHCTKSYKLKKKPCDKYLYDSEDKQLEYEPPSLCYLMYWVQTMWY